MSNRPQSQRTSILILEPSPLSEVDETDFDVDVFLQSCAEFMSLPFTPSPNAFTLIPVPASAHTPPYSDEEDAAKRRIFHTQHPHPASHNALHHIMPSNPHFSAHQGLNSPPAEHHSVRDASSTALYEESFPLFCPSSSLGTWSDWQRSEECDSFAAEVWDHAEGVASDSARESFSATEASSSLSDNAPTFRKGRPPSPKKASSSTCKKSSSSGQKATAKALKSSLPKRVPYTTREVPKEATFDNSIQRLLEEANEIESERASQRASFPTTERVPRPANSWIMYRSHMVKRLKEDEKNVPGINAARRELGLPAWPTVPGALPDPSRFLGAEGRRDTGTAPDAESRFRTLAGKEGHNIPQADVSKVISILWRNESQDVKTRFEQLAEVKAIEHMKLYPDYKYKPLRKAEKLKQRETKEQEKQEKRRLKEELKISRRKRISRLNGSIQPSPSSPYPPQMAAHHDMGSIAKDLDYQGGDEGASMASAVDLSNTMFGRPFPLPQSAMPALEDGRGSTPAPAPAPSAAIAQEYIWRHGPPGNHAEDIDYSSVPMSQVPSSSSLTLPPAHTLPGSPTIPDADVHTWAPSQPPLVPALAGSALPSDDLLADYQNAWYGISPNPFDFGAMPLDVIDLDSIPELPEDPSGGADPNMLAEIWFEMASPEKDETGAKDGPNGLIGLERALDLFNPEALDSNIFEFAAPQPENGEVPQPHHLWEDPSGGVMYSYQVQLPQEEEVVYPMFAPADMGNGVYVPSLDSAAGYLGMMPLDFGSHLARSSFDHGPFLSTQQPMSPTDSASVGHTPIESNFLQAGNGAHRRDAPSDGPTRKVSSAAPVPRYVSSSAYPLTPHSLDSVGLPLDRSTSFAANAMWSNTGMGMMADDILSSWDEDEVNAEYVAANDSVYVAGCAKGPESEPSAAEESTDSTSTSDKSSK